MIAGLQNLRRYFELIVFQSYLQSIEPDTIQSLENENLETFVKNRPGACRLPLLSHYKRNLCCFSDQDFRKGNDWRWNQCPQTTRPCR